MASKTDPWYERLDNGREERQATIALLRHIAKIRRDRGWKVNPPKSPLSPVLHVLDTAFRTGLDLQVAVNRTNEWARLTAGDVEPDGIHFHKEWIAKRLLEEVEAGDG